LSKLIARGKLSLLNKRPVRLSRNHETAEGVRKMINRALCVLFLLAAASFAAAQTTPPSAPASQPSQTPNPAQPRPTPVVPHTHLKVGQPAPDFDLPSTIVGADGRGVRYKLSDFKGKKNVVLAFYVLAFTGG
jgi:AhpC/TSA family protein